VYQIPQLLKYDNLNHYFSQKSDGNMANFIGDNPHIFEDATANRKMFFEKTGLDINKTVCMWVTHGDQIVELPDGSMGSSMFDFRKTVKVDGLITNKKGINLFLLIADCLPVIIYDPVQSAVGLIHAGWKGVDLEISKKAVDQFKLKFISNTDDLIVGIGPCAYKESFIKENPSQKDDPRWKSFITKVGENRYSIDLISFTKKQLIDAGVKKENIFESGVDTVKDERFFSHVRESGRPINEQGRFACVVGLK
jgi:hypothetical protein